MLTSLCLERHWRWGTTEKVCEITIVRLCYGMAEVSTRYASTTYGLYRDGTELRGVYYALPNVARSACLSLGDACDYPVLLGKYS